MGFIRGYDLEDKDTSRDLHSRAAGDSALSILRLPAPSAPLASAEGEMKPNSQQLWVWIFRRSKV